MGHVEMLEGRRLLSAGLLDTSFGNHGRFTINNAGRADRAYGVVVGIDGSIYVGGSTEDSNAATNQSDFALAKLTSAGAAAGGFGSGGLVQTDFMGGQDFGYAMAQQADGKIILAGVAYNADLTQSDIALARYNTNGTLDNTFGTSGKVLTNLQNFESASGVAIDSNGKIVVVGTTTAGGAGASQGVVARYNANGTLDNTFGSSGLVSAGIMPKATAVAIASDDSIYYTGNNGSTFTIAHLTPAGALDGGYGTNGVTTQAISGSATAYALLILPNGKIVAAGEATPTSSLNAAMAFACFNTDGSLDTTFGTNGVTTVDITGSIDQALSLVKQADGKFIAVGFAAGSGSGDFATVRLTSHGLLDASWGKGGTGVTDIAGAQDNARAATIDASGRLIIAGQGTVSGSVDMAVTRHTLGDSAQIGIFRNGAVGLDSDSNRGWNPGSDSSFTIGQAGDKVVTGDWNGDGITETGVFRGGVWILDTNGTPGFQAGDTTFAFGIAGWTPVVGDWNGDGRTDVGVYNGAQWALDDNGTQGWQAGSDHVITFGDPSYTPVVGDWNGDGKADIGVFANGVWGLDSNGTLGWQAGSDASFAFGAAGMAPVVGDWNGDGTSDVGVFTGGTWGLDSDGTRGYTAGDATFAFGAAGWTPVIGDWNGDGKSDVGVFTGARWGIDTDSIRGWTANDTSFAFGLAGDEPIIGKW